MTDPPDTEDTSREPIGASTVTVVATRLQLRSWRNLLQFFRINSAVERQLKADPDLILYRLRADFLRLQFSTMSFWTGEDAIDGFVRTGEHLEALRAFDIIAVRERSAFVRWETAGPDAVTWKECRRRLAALPHAS